MEVSEFRKTVLEYLRKLNENSNRIFSPIFEQYELTMLQVMILGELKCGSSSIGNLAEGIHVAGSNVSSMCKKLEQKGILERFRASEDERVVKVILTEKGKAIISEIENASNEKLLRHINDVTEKNFEDIISRLEELNNLLEKVASE